MKIVCRAAKVYARSLTVCLALLCASAVSLSAQGTASAAPAAGQASTPLDTRIHGTMVLDAAWRFQVGDDPRWADPTFDDSAWPMVTLSQALSEQGFDAYSGYGWYRLRLQPQQLSSFNIPGAASRRCSRKAR